MGDLLTRRVKRSRTTGLLLAALLACGFVYSGLAVVGGYGDIFRTAAADGPSATVDQYVAPAGLRSASQLREAVARAGWGPEEEVLLVAEMSALSRQDIVQTQYVAGYTLYPMRVALVAWCDGAASNAQCAALPSSTDPMAEAASRHARHVMFIGRTNPFPSASSQRVSDLLTLVNVP